LFGFLGWASLLIPVYLFMEAIQVWWPRSFLNRPFRYAAQFFLLLTTSALLFLFWQVPADTLDNSSGGIIGYELGQSLEQLLTVYGAAFFLLVLWVVLFTLAFGVKWNKTWSSLKATPAYLQDLFYRNVPEGMSDFDRTAPVVKKEPVNAAKKMVAVTPAPEHELVDIDPVVRDQVAERLFDDFADKESQQPQFYEDIPEAEQHAPEPVETFKKEQQEPPQSDRVVATGEVWRALHSNEDQRHKQDIDALLKAAEEEQADFCPDAFAAAPTNHHAHELTSSTVKNLDWDDDEIFDELLAAVPQGKTATDVHSPFNSAAAEKSLRIVEDAGMVSSTAAAP